MICLTVTTVVLPGHCRADDHLGFTNTAALWSSVNSQSGSCDGGGRDRQTGRNVRIIKNDSHQQPYTRLPVKGCPHHYHQSKQILYLYFPYFLREKCQTEFDGLTVSVVVQHWES